MCARDLPRGVRHRHAQWFGLLLLSQLTASGMLAPLLDGWRIVIETPLQHLSKGEIIRRGDELDAPYALTTSCYRGGDTACGVCDSCLLRLRGFAEAGLHDPIPYAAGKN